MENRLSENVLEVPVDDILEDPVSFLKSVDVDLQLLSNPTKQDSVRNNKDIRMTPKLQYFKWFPLSLDCSMKKTLNLYKHNQFLKKNLCLPNLLLR